MHSRLISLCSILFATCCGIAFNAFFSRTNLSPALNYDIQDSPLKWSRWVAGSAKDQELSAVMTPSARISSISKALHYLYFHGTDAIADKDITGADPRPILPSLLDGTLVPNQPSIFYRGADGFLRAAESIDPGGEKHPGQTLAYLGKCGISAHQKVVLRDETVDIRDILSSSLATFTNSGEIEWWVLAFLHYLPPNRSWTNRWGVEFSFDSLANDLLARELGSGPCYGIHALEVMVAMVKINDQYPIVEQITEQRLMERIRYASTLLRQNQCPDGGWERIWYQPPKAGSSASLHSTGHHLEWILDAPEALRPPPESVEFAVRACRQRLKTATVQDVNSDICTYSHAIKSVVLFDSIREEQ